MLRYGDGIPDCNRTGMWREGKPEWNKLRKDMVTFLNEWEARGRLDAKTFAFACSYANKRKARQAQAIVHSAKSSRNAVRVPLGYNWVTGIRAVNGNLDGAYDIYIGLAVLE